MRRGGLNHTHASSLLLTRCRVGLARRGNEVRTMQHRIDELNVIALAEQPPRQVRDVRGCGACFFLALSLAIGEVLPHTRVWESVQYCGLIKKIEPQQFSLYSRSHRRARPGAVMPSGAGRTKRGPQGRTRLNLYSECPMMMHDPHSYRGLPNGLSSLLYCIW